MSEQRPPGEPSDEATTGDRPTPATAAGIGSAPQSPAVPDDPAAAPGAPEPVGPPATAADPGERTVSLRRPPSADPPATQPADPAGPPADVPAGAVPAAAGPDGAGLPGGGPTDPGDGAPTSVLADPDGPANAHVPANPDGPPSPDGPASPDGLDGSVEPLGSAGGAPARDDAAAGARHHRLASWTRLSPAGALICVLTALLGFTLVVQLRSNDTDEGMAAARPDDLVRILSDLEARETRLNTEINGLEESQRQLTSGVQGRQAALEEAGRRANELGLLAGTLRARGPGLVITMTPGDEAIKASDILNTVQELRGSGGEVMQLAGSDGTAVRVVASTAFVDGDGGVVVDGVRLTGPFVLTVIGAPQTMEPALNIPGGVVAEVGKAGGTVIAEQRKTVEVTAVREASNLQYARPVS